jgi:hypothetical protein
VFKVKNTEGQCRGGPAFYIAKGLRAPWAAVIFLVSLILSFGLAFNAVQANSIADAVEGAFGLLKLVTGLVIAAIMGLVIFGGIRQVAKVAKIVAPFVAGVYLLLAVSVVLARCTTAGSKMLIIELGLAADDDHIRVGEQSARTDLDPRVAGVDLKGAVFELLPNLCKRVGDDQVYAVRWRQP